MMANEINDRIKKYRKEKKIISDYASNGKIIKRSVKLSVFYIYLLSFAIGRPTILK